MDGLPKRRKASVNHACRKCGMTIKRGEEYFSIPQKSFLSRKWYTVALCLDCGRKHIAAILGEAQMLERMCK